MGEGLDAGVEGGDLTVRDATVYLKTLSGLRRVHAIMRRLDDDFCDPLELRGDSFLGVSGLVKAVIAGNVKVANALGSGLQGRSLLGDGDRGDGPVEQRDAQFVLEAGDGA